MAVSATKIQAQGIDLTTTVSADSDSSLTTDSSGLLKSPQTATVTSGGTIPITNGGVYNALGNRTQIVTDSAPTSASSNFLTSGAIYTALQNISTPRLVFGETPSGSMDGTNRYFSLAHTLVYYGLATPDATCLAVFYNGQMLTPNVDYAFGVYRPSGLSSLGYYIYMNTYIPSQGDNLTVIYQTTEETT